MSDRYQYGRPQALLTPGPIGRIVRLVFAVGCASLLQSLLAARSEIISGSDLNQMSWTPMIVLAIYVFPDVLNIGFGLKLQRRTLYSSLLVAGTLAALAGRLIYGMLVAPPLGMLLFGWLLYTFGHLGISFLLAAVLGTPGCEMRSIPHLWARVTRQPLRAHYCPGIMSPLDRWEAGLRGAGDGRG